MSGQRLTASGRIPNRALADLEPGAVADSARDCGEVVNRPTWAAGGSSAMVVVPALAQWVPSAES